MTSALTISSLDRQDLVAALAPEWEDLRARIGATASQGFAYAMRGWETTSGPGARLNVVVARRGERLVGLWPLHVAVGAKGRALVRHLGCGGHEEYAGPLVDPAEADPRSLIQAMYDVAATAGDVLEVYNALDGSPLQAMVREDTRAKFANQSSSLVVGCAGAASWAEWFAAKSKSFRDGRKQDRKRLMALGELAFRRVSAEDAVRHVEWCFDTKVRWLDEHGIASGWMRGQAVREFYAGLVGRGVGVDGFALDLDGRTIAGCLCLESATTLEFYLTTFDPEYGRYSPGNVLIEDLVRWCIEHRLDFDFRLLESDYKRRWADKDFQVETTYVATSRKGAALIRERERALLIQRGKRWLKSLVARRRAV